jgi:predicted RecA/RadA family phage recombinase
MQMRVFGNIRVLALLVAVGAMGHAQLSTNAALTTSSSSLHSVEAKLLVGLKDIPSGAKGAIDVTPDSLIFTSSYVTDRLPRGRVSGVFVGDERAETGGFAGKVARIAIPYGGGAALGTVTQKQVSILTVDYRDDRDGLRSAVFVLPKAAASEIASEMQLSLMSHPRAASPVVCSIQDVSTSIRVLPIQSMPGLELAPEYRALLYEHLVELPAQKLRVDRIFPDGELRAGCATYTLTLTVEEFSKGNAALRASTGPAGLFVGVTKLTVRAQLRDSNGRIILDKQVKASGRGDKESLNVASSEVTDIAKAINKTNIRTKEARLEE